MLMNRAKEILAKAAKMPPLSASAARLMQLVGEENHSARDVAKLVECDAVLTAHVLRVSNSVAMGLREPMTSVDRAVSYLGDRTVLGIAIGICATQVYDHPMAGYEGDRGILWRHSLCTAIAARELTKFSATPINPAVAFTAGILHDIGKALISEYLQKSTREAVAKNWDTVDFLKAEKESLGTDHCEVGMALAQQWRIPKVLISPIRWHHSPAEAPADDQPLAFAVHAGDMISMIVGSGTGIDALRYPMDARYKEFFKLNSSELERLVLIVGLEFEKIKSSLFNDKSEQERSS